MDIKLFNKWYLQLVKGIFFIVAGIIILKLKTFQLLFAPFYLGIFFSVFGILDILTSFTHKNINFSWQWLLAEGLQYLLSGFILVIKQDITQTNMEFFIGIIALFTGIIHFTASINYKNAGILGYHTITINGLACILFGIAILFSRQLYGILEAESAFLFVLYIITEGIFTVINTFLPRHVAYNYDE
jgi:uncharacterized membrane protein HdeD (DUF308 family)